MPCNASASRWRAAPGDCQGNNKCQHCESSAAAGHCQSGELCNAHAVPQLRGLTSAAKRSFGTFTRVNTTLKGRCVKVVGPTLETCGLRLSCNATQHLRPGAVLCAGGLGASSSFAARRCTACEHAWSKQPALHLHLSYPPAGRRRTGQGACQAKQCWRGHSWHCGQLQRVTGLAGSPCVWERPCPREATQPEVAHAVQQRLAWFHKGAGSAGLVTLPCMPL